MIVNIVLHQLDRSGGCRVLVVAAQALARKGFRVNIVIPNGTQMPTFPIDPRVSIREVGPRLSMPGPVGTFLRTMILTFFLPFSDVVLFSYYLVAWPIFARWVFRRAGTVVYFVQANEPFVFGTLANNARWLRRAAASLSLRFPFSYLSNSNYVSAFLWERCRKRAPVVHPGVDSKVFFPKMRGEDGSVPRVAVVANSMRAKGWPMVVDTLRLLNRLRPDFEVVVLGSKPLPGLEFLNKRVHWSSAESDSEVALVLRGATAFFSSSMSEGFGLPVLESLAVGSPVVASDSGGVRDILVHGLNGYLVPYGDGKGAAACLNELFGDSIIRERLRSAALETAERFSWAPFEEKLLEFVWNLGPKKDLVSRDVWDEDARQTLKRSALVHSELLEEIRKQVPPGSTLLELGAQRGKDASLLAGEGYHVFTVDYSDEAIQMMQSSYGDMLHIVKADIRALPFREGSFSLVYSQGLLEHFFEPDLGRIILEQRRVVSRSGFVLVDVPNLFSPLTIPKHILMALGKYVLPQESQYSWRGLRRIVGRHGLRYVRHYSWGYDRLIGRPMVRALENMPLGLGRLFEVVRVSAERTFGDYFLKCIGVFFTKDQDYPHQFDGKP